jgi:hypothetical protein
MTSTGKIYKSKIGLEIAIPLTLVIGGTWILLTFQEPYWVGTVILMPVVLFIVYMFNYTHYTITQEHLIVRGGFLVHLKIEVKRIRIIRETNNPLSSPANSLDRLAIIYNDNSSVLISPKDKHGFIADLLALNSEIEVVYRKKKA